MSGPLIALSLLGAGMQAYNQYQEGKAQAKSLLAQIEVNNLKAEEIEKRLSININRTEKASQTFQSTQIASMAGSGFEVGGVATLQQLEDTASKALDEIDNLTREAEFEMEAIRLENQSLQESARRVKKAGKLRAFGSLLAGGASTFYKSPGLSKTPKKD